MHLYVENTTLNGPYYLSSKPREHSVVERPMNTQCRARNSTLLGFLSFQGDKIGVRAHFGDRKKSRNFRVFHNMDNDHNQF